ncbi:unnamed protein product [Gongylonema pulchrum]|uniref:Meth_synt_2 domain-containing protein n=1 Tax=Gongylonema pulchrum TaxID=637853 RepID=A0A183E914_9BILA|nr:unnamed protein product [Gongylonema pulchrum]
MVREVQKRMIAPARVVLSSLASYAFLPFVVVEELKGFDEVEIQKRVNEYRKLLQSQVESGELNIDAELSTRDTHVWAKAAIQNRNRMRAAFGIKDDFIDGTSFEKLVSFLCVSCCVIAVQNAYCHGVVCVCVCVCSQSNFSATFNS